MPLAGGSLGRQLEDLREELGGPRGGLEVRGLEVVVADESSWIGVADDRHVQRENLNEVAVSNVARHRRVRRDDELGERSYVVDKPDIAFRHRPEGYFVLAEEDVRRWDKSLANKSWCAGSEGARMKDRAVIIATDARLQARETILATQIAISHRQIVAVGLVYRRGHDVVR